MLIKAPFSYYGSKSKLAHLYPEPKVNLVVEPFAGAGCYSWLHRKNRQVWLNDLDARTHSIWSFLTDEDALDMLNYYLPDDDTIKPGMKVSGDVLPETDASCYQLTGLREICRAEANQGTQGGKGVHDQITSMGAKCWKVKRKLLEVIPEVVDWHITNLNYTDMQNVYATWFIDPPYNNPAGKRYRQSNINYAELAAYCQSRRGQTIVCENAGATWLPFTPMKHNRVSIRSRYQKADAKEVVWVIENP